MSNSPRIERVRHELKRRTLTIRRVEKLAPEMVRIVLSGDELQGFTSLGFDDHVKVFFPSADAQSTAPSMRDYTPRKFDADAGELSIDFYLHEAGPATSWAAQAAVGQSLVIGGPKGSAVISPEGIDAHVFIGDETALPAISRRLDELPPDVRTLVVLEHEIGSTLPSLVGRDGIEVVSAPRNGSAADGLIEVLRKVQFPNGACFVWVALESRAARAIRRYLREERGLAKEWIKAAGYWQRGAAGAHDKIADEE